MVEEVKDAARQENVPAVVEEDDEQLFINEE